MTDLLNGTPEPQNQAQRALNGVLFKSVVEKALRDLGISGVKGVVLVAAFDDGSACQLPAGKMTVAGYCFMAQTGAGALAESCEAANERLRQMAMNQIRRAN